MHKKYYISIISLLLIVLGFSAYNYSEKQPKSPQASPLPHVTKDRYERGHNIQGKLYWAGSAQDKEVALTFDDGPEDKWTPEVLAILKQKNIKATFFVIGEQAQKYPDILRRIHAEGHVIGNHTLTHADLTKLDSQQVDHEIEQCALVIQKIIGKTPRFVRPPFGFHNATVDNIIYSKGRMIILWSLDTKDWTGLDTEAIKARILPKMQNGYIVLQHDGENAKLGGSVHALPDIIDELKAQGFTFVTISELLDTKPYQ